MPRYALVLTGPKVSAEHVADASQHLAQPWKVTERWLAESVACEWQIEAAQEEARDLLSRIRATLAPAPIDINLVNADTNRRKRLLIADMDSTIIEQECIDELADYAGHGPAVAAITEQAMRGELDFDQALKTRVALLEGLATATLKRVIQERLTITPGARTLVATMSANGAFCALVSGGFTFFTQRIAARVGFHEHRANTLEFADEKLTGAVVLPILGRQAKLDALNQITATHNISMPATLAVGDGANDLAMIREAGLGVAFHAKPLVAAEANAQVNHCDLTALLYLQGYRKDEFMHSPPATPTL